MALHGVLISLMDIEPSVGIRLHPIITALEYQNKLYLHYYCQLLATNFSELVLV